jgi:hypothetical protein
MDTIFAIIGCVILSVVGVIGISIKEKTNVFTNLYQFFEEWGLYIVNYGIPAIIILFVIACIGMAWSG